MTILIILNYLLLLLVKNELNLKLQLLNYYKNLNELQQNFNEFTQIYNNEILSLIIDTIKDINKLNLNFNTQQIKINQNDTINFYLKKEGYFEFFKNKTYFNALLREE